jgi:hypothetical protein
LLIDGSSDLHQRNPLAIQLSGRLDGVLWSYLIRFCEPTDHEAKTQLMEIIATFEEMNALACSFTERKLSVLDLYTIIFDTTSSNTGLENGLAG